MSVRTLGSRRRRSRLYMVAAIAGVVLLVIAGGSVAAYSVVRSKAGDLQSNLANHLALGQQQLEAGKSALAKANSTHDPKLAAQAKVDFFAAQSYFIETAQIADQSRLLSDLESLPAVGPQAHARHGAVDAIAAMGLELSRAGVDLADLDAKLLAPSGGSTGGQTLLNVLTSTNAGLASVRSELVLAQQAAARVKLDVLTDSQKATFIKARGAIATALAGIEEFQNLMPVFTEALGGNGKRTYLIEQVNPAELRAGGGFIGTYSVLQADKGALRMLRSGDATDIGFPRPLVGQPGYVQPPGPIRELIGAQSWSFIDSNFFADFPTNAQAGERFAQPGLRLQFDAVISIDYYAVAKILELTGGLPVPGYRLTLDSKNFIPTVVQYDLDAATDPSALAVHKAILSALAGPLMQRLSTLPPQQWPSLISALNDLATQRHLQAYFNSGTVQQAIQNFEWTGDLHVAPGADFMMEVESNLGGTKANYFVTRRYSVTLTRRGDLLHHQVTVTIVNAMPYLYHPHEGYRVYIRLIVPASSSGRSDSLVADKLPPPTPPPDVRQLDGWLAVPGYGNSRTAVFAYDTPWQPGSTGADAIYWQKQPGTGNDAVAITWDDGQGHSFKAGGALNQDLVISLGQSGVTLAAGQKANAALPSLNLG